MPCDCGRPTTMTCWNSSGQQPMVPCLKLVCGPECKVHRHQPGTMCYVHWGGTTNYTGDAPDGPGVWEWLKSRCRALFWSDAQKAQRVWDEMVANFPPPAPLPMLRLIIGWKRFEPRGHKMVEVAKWTE